MRTGGATTAGQGDTAQTASPTLWALRAAERLPGSAPVQGLALATFLMGVELAATLATPPAGRLGFAWFRLLSLPLLSGYLWMGLQAIARGGSRALDSLAPVLELEPGGAARSVGALRSLPRAARGIAAGVALGIPIFVGLRLPEVRDAALAGHPQLLAFGAMAALFWWLTAQAVALLLRQARCFRDLAQRSLRVDLFDLGPLAPFGRLAVRNALLVSGGLALAVALAATPEAQAAWVPRIQVAAGVGLLPLILAGGATCGLIALALPLLGVHRRLRDEKDAALARVARALPPHDAAISDLATATPERTAALLAIRDSVAATPEWPLDAAMLRRFGLYALLPAASWLLRLALEEGVERALG